LRPAKRRVRAKFENEIVVVLIVHCNYVYGMKSYDSRKRSRVKFESKSFEIVHTRHDIN
jgi:hypothetical protein